MATHGPKLQSISKAALIGRIQERLQAHSRKVLHWDVAISAFVLCDLNQAERIENIETYGRSLGVMRHDEVVAG